MLLNLMTPTCHLPGRDAFYVQSGQNRSYPSTYAAVAGFWLELAGPF